MKQKDIGLILVIAIISGAISIVVSNLFLATDSDRKQAVEVVAPINSDFQTPPAKYFNNKALDPTRLIEISEDPNSKPFEE